MPETRTTLRAATAHDAPLIARLHTLSWQTARTIGVDKVHLSVLEGNVRAIGFYEHNGWQLAGIETSRIGQTEVTDRIYAIQA
ncbi:hypothetical protein ACPUER_05480 [Burkholderia sp. DN3021]|uniref:hypothetical protein n=1 Tax=Burkholderia sp. DN3021 TaxID=3410137 RepID=UPI003C79A172